MGMRKLLFFAPLLVAFGLGIFLWRGLALNPQDKFRPLFEQYQQQ
jgi:hypothetical protein